MRTLGIVLPIIFILIIDNIDATAVNIAIPTLMQEFSTSLVFTSWVINIYISTSAAFFLLAGYFGRIFGPKITILLGTTLLGSASILIGCSSNMPLLLIGRFIQGAGYAFTFAMVFLIVKQCVPKKHQKFVISLLTSFVALSSTAGPLIGGAFIYYLSWRWIFLINIPLCTLCIIFLIIYMKDIPKANTISLKEIFTLLLSMLMIFFLMLTIFYATNDVRKFGLFLILFAIFLFFFLFFERRFQTNVINFSDFLVKRFSSVIIDRFVMQIISFSFFLSIPLFLEKIEGMNPSHSGLFFSIMTLTTALTSLLVGLFYKNSRTWIAIIFGFVTLISACICCLVFLLYSINSFLVLSFIIFGLSFGVLYPQVNIELMGSLAEVKDRNMGSGLFYASSFLFGVIGVCITTAILDSSGAISKSAYMHLMILWIVLTSFGVISRSIRKANDQKLKYSAD